MIPMKTFWCEDTPTVEDILAAYQEVQQGAVVMIYWAVSYDGLYHRVITEDTVKQFPNCQDYWDKCLPHIYGL